MRNTRKANKVICFTGADAKKDGIHTPEEFLELTKKWKKSPLCKNGCPKNNNVNAWMKWSGAIKTNSKTCKKNSRNVAKNLNKINLEIQEQRKKTLRNIKSGKYQKQLAQLGVSKESIQKMVNFELRQ